MAYVHSNGVEIFYDVVGSSPASVFLHGDGGNGASWFQQIGAFADGFTCVIIDNRGSGRSRLADPELYQPPKFTGDVLRVMDQEHIDSAVFVCQSLGGWTGLRLALEAPSRVRALVISD